jgi:hypothetical protein
MYVASTVASSRTRGTPDEQRGPHSTSPPVPLPSIHVDQRSWLGSRWIQAGLTRCARVRWCATRRSIARPRHRPLTRSRRRQTHRQTSFLDDRPPAMCACRPARTRLNRRHRRSTKRRSGRQKGRPTRRPNGRPTRHSSGRPTRHLIRRLADSRSTRGCFVRPAPTGYRADGSRRVPDGGFAWINALAAGTTGGARADANHQVP